MKLKLVLVGPSKVGKTRIANYLAEFEESPNYETYNPTVSRSVPHRTASRGHAASLRCCVLLRTVAAAQLYWRQRAHLVAHYLRPGCHRAPDQRRTYRRRTLQWRLLAEPPPGQ